MLQAENNDDSSRRQLLQNTLSSAAFLAVGLSPSLANAADIESFTLPSYGKLGTALIFFVSVIRC